MAWSTEDGQEEQTPVKGDAPEKPVETQPVDKPRTLRNRQGRLALD